MGDVIVLVLGLMVFAGPMSTEVPAATAAQGSTVSREDIEWLGVWLPQTNDGKLPRVLLIGDSITPGYDPEVEEALAGPPNGA
jgi:hypothetical protein